MPESIVDRYVAGVYAENHSPVSIYDEPDVFGAIYAIRSEGRTKDVKFRIMCMSGARIVEIWNIERDVL